MQKASKMVVMNDKPKTDDLEKLKKLFKKSDTKPQRNAKILEAYQTGISQHKIAAFLQLSQPTVNAIIKREERKGNDTINITDPIFYIGKLRQNDTPKPWSRWA